MRWPRPAAVTLRRASSSAGSHTSIPVTAHSGQTRAADTASRPTPVPMSRSDETSVNSPEPASSVGIIIEARPTPSSSTGSV